MLKWILKEYWQLGDGFCWFMSFNVKDEFGYCAERMHDVFDLKTFPVGFEKLLADSKCFMRDVVDKKGEILEIVTDKITMKEIQEKIFRLPDL